MPIPRILDDEGLENLMNEPISKAVVDFLEFATLRACAGMRLNSGPQSIGETSLRCFIARILFYSQIPVKVSLAVSVYLGRLGWALGSGRSGSNTTPHRMFFGCLVLTAKYLIDEPRSSYSWEQCLLLSCNNMFFTKEGIRDLEIEILKKCQWRSDIHEHDLLPELELFAEFVRMAVWQVPMYSSDVGCQVPSELTEQRMREIETFIGHIRETCHARPCALCMTDDCGTWLAGKSCLSTWSNEKSEEPGFPLTLGDEHIIACTGVNPAIWKAGPLIMSELISCGSLCTEISPHVKPQGLDGIKMT